MSKFSIRIGQQEFSSKKEALIFYKNILNSYEANQTLNPKDFTFLQQLLYRRNTDIRDNSEKRLGVNLRSIKVDYHPEFKGTKCFFLIDDQNNEEIFSYTYAINGLPSDYTRFVRACRFLVAPRLRKFKAAVFKNRPVKCAITNQVVEWEECQVDHKVPLTFSVIVKSFIVAHDIDVSNILYRSKITKEEFEDQDLADLFDQFHKKMAVLRVVSTKENKKLASKSRIKPTKKDGVLR